MREIQTISEIWEFFCLRCLRTWQDLYEACRSDDGHGGDTVVWRRGGLPSPPPWSDLSCPHCHNIYVKPLPSRNRSPICRISEMPQQDSPQQDSIASN